MKRWRTPVRISLSLAVIGLALLAGAKAGAIEDWFKLRNYTPEPSVVSLVNQDSMTAYAKHIFYINHPQLITNVSQFRQACPENEQTIVLGCYHPGETGIDLYNVQDQRLAGVQQVTAAHEMLHGAYERLSAKDKQYVNGLLQDYFNNDLHDQRIIDTINAYKKSEPNDVVNEMHSVFGTEVVSLPTALENYYKKYFTNRQVVAGFAQSYQAVFTDRTNQINSYDSQLASLKQLITGEENALSDQLNQINSQRSQLDQLRADNQISQYNDAVPGFNRLVDAYNAGVVRLKDDIANYNSIVTARNSIASDLASLDSAIDTRLSTQSTQ